MLLENKHDGKQPSMIGPVLVHDKNTTETYSIFAGTIKTLRPCLSEVLSFGTDSEKPLIDGFKNNFDRSVNLLCVLHLKKNVERKLLDLGISGNVKQDILADVFGKQSGNVFESGLADTPGRENFQQQLEQLKEKWSKCRTKGMCFFKWFQETKAEEFINSVISPVRERAGLCCPPDKFTTNRSEKTNGIIQDFVRGQNSGKKIPVDEYFFTSRLQQLVKIQKQEIELAVVGRGEYRLREPFRYLEVSTNEWSRMWDGQREEALLKIHTITVEEATSSNVTGVTKALSNEQDAVMKQIVSLGIDWLPHEILSSMVTKANSLAKDEKSVVAQSSETVIVKSNSDPRKLHIVNIYPNSKGNCDNCLGFTSSLICAHVVAACIYQDKQESFLRWFVKTKRNSGGDKLHCGNFVRNAERARQKGRNSA